MRGMLHISQEKGIEKLVPSVRNPREAPMAAIHGTESGKIENMCIPSVSWQPCDVKECCFYLQWSPELLKNLRLWWQPDMRFIENWSRLNRTFGFVLLGFLPVTQMSPWMGFIIAEKNMGLVRVNVLIDPVCPCCNSNSVCWLHVHAKAERWTHLKVAPTVPTPPLVISSTDCQHTFNYLKLVRAKHPQNLFLLRPNVETKFKWEMHRVKCETHNR